MGFFQFLKKIKNRRFLVPSLIIFSVIVFGGSVFGLARSGMLSTFADSLVKTSKQLILQQSGTQYGSVHITVDPTNNGGGGPAFYRDGVAIPVTGGWRNGDPNTYIYDIPSLQLGQYEYLFGMPGNGQPCIGPLSGLNHAWTSTIVYYPKFTCDGTTPTTTLIQGQVIKSGDNLTIPGATVTIGSKPAVTTDTSGYYIVNDIPAGSYTATVAKSGYNTLTQSVTIIAGVNNKNFNLVLTAPDLPEYKFTGNVMGDNGAYLSGVTVEIIDKNLTDNQAILTTQSGSQGAYSGGYNYLTQNKVTRANLNNVFVRFTPTTASGYSTQELKLTDTGVIAGTTLVGSGTDIYMLEKIKNVTLARSSFDLYYIVNTRCTDINLCPNRNASGMIDRAPVSIVGQPDQLSSNLFNPTAVSGVFRNITSGSKQIFVNATTNPNYIQAYLPKSQTFDVATATILPIAGIGNVHVVTVTLDRNTAYQPQTTKFDLQGLLTDKTGSPTAANVRISCENDTDCPTWGVAKHQTSLIAKSAKNGLDQNYYFPDLNNIAVANYPVSELTLKIDKENSYVDTNGDNMKNPGEDGTFKITKDDIRVIGGKSVCVKSFAIRSIADSDIRISGTVKVKANGSPVRSKIKLLEVQPDGSFAEFAMVPAIWNASDGTYVLAGLRGKVDLNKDYMLVAEPTAAYSTEMVAVRFGLQPVLQIDFLLEPNNGEYLVFTGYIQNIDANGNIQNLSNADTTIAIGDRPQYGIWSTDPSSLQYKIQLNSSEIFGDTQNGSIETVQLTGFNGKALRSTKHKTYKIPVTRGRGVIVRRDFQFFASDQLDPAQLTKNVRIRITTQEKDYRKVSTGSTPQLYGKSAPTPLQGAKVKLVSLRSSNTSGQSGYVVSSEEVSTEADGVAVFTGYPKQESKILVTLPNGYEQYIIEGTDATLALGATQTSRGINYYKLPWDPAALKQAKESIEMQQWYDSINSPWGNDYIAGGFGNTIENRGCCLTSLSMAIKFYYPTKLFDGQLMSPHIFYNLTKRDGVPGLALQSQFPSLIGYFNRDYGTDVQLTKITTDQIDGYLKSGIPVVFYADGLTHNGHTHGTHCVLMTDVSQSGQYGIINPYMKHDPIGYIDSSSFGKYLNAYAVTTTASKNYFHSVRGQSNSGNIAHAADGNTNARQDSDYLVTANIGSDTVAKIQKVFLKLKRPNSADVLMEMEKNADNYSFAIPKYMINSVGFSYQFVALNTFGAQIESQEYPVTVDRIAWTPTVTINRAFSALKFGIYNYRNIPNVKLTTLTNAINNAYQNFRTAFNTFLTRMGINQSDLVSVSGQVVNASGQRMPKVIVKIWQDAALSEGGTFTVANVQRGLVPIEVSDQTTGKTFLLSNPSYNVTGSVSNLRIIVDDPQDVGTLNAYSFWSSTPYNSMVAANAVKVGKIQLIRNARVEKEINLASVSGKINLNNLQVGSYTVKYINGAGIEKTTLFINRNTSFQIRRGQITNEIIKIDDGVSFKLKFVGSLPYGSCDYWNYNRAAFYITPPNSTEYNSGVLPLNCEITVNYPQSGIFRFRLIDKNGNNSTISPAYIDIPPMTNGKTYEIRIL